MSCCERIGVTRSQARGRPALAFIPRSLSTPIAAEVRILDEQRRTIRDEGTPSGTPPAAEA